MGDGDRDGAIDHPEVLAGKLVPEGEAAGESAVIAPDDPGDGGEEEGPPLGGALASVDHVVASELGGLPEGGLGLAEVLGLGLQLEDARGLG
eukprot:12428441-Alexandrium_andersonii.AAC.1